MQRAEGEDAHAEVRNGRERCSRKVVCFLSLLLVNGCMCNGAAGRRPHWGRAIELVLTVGAYESINGASV